MTSRLSSQLPRLLPWLCCSWLGAGCSSEALETPEPAGGRSGTGGSGGSTQSGGAAPGGSNAGAAPGELPDYANSDCFGQSRSTLVYDGQTHETAELVAYCRGETSRVRLYVADELFGSTITQQQINGFLHRYELVGNERSYRPDLGVLPTDEAVFGALDPSRIDGDKLPIFVIDTNDAGDGYLCSWCKGDELHLDGTALDPLDGDTALSIAAHESFHAIHRGYDADESMWVDETLAEAAMSVNGYYTDRAVLNDFARRPNVNWGPARSQIGDYHYGAGLAYGTWLWEFGGEALMRAATSAKENGWAGIDAALQASGHPETGLDTWLDMAVALYLDDPERGYGFRSFDLVMGVGVEALATGATISASLAPYGLAYYSLSEDVGSVRVEAAGGLQGRLLFDRDPVEILPLELGVELELGGQAGVLILTAASNAAVSYTVSTP
jgi:hypothetical protein